MNSVTRRVLTLVALFLLATVTLGNPIKVKAQVSPPAPNPVSGSTGIEGTVPAKPPTEAATITVPGNGQNFSTTPITVAGLCPKGLLVEIFKNNIFSGSVTCSPSGSFTLQVDLFEGRNDLIARVFDSLNQAGPDSNTVSVTFTPPLKTSGPRITITTAYAKRGAVPGSTLSWPIVISGGTGPYAISVDWGDKTPADLMSRGVGGEVNLEHVYKQAGVYNVVIKATDANGVTAFLQVVGIGNGPIQQAVKNNSNIIIQTKWIWWPLIVSLVLIVAAFWLGRRQQVEQIRVRLRQGKSPF